MGFARTFAKKLAMRKISADRIYPISSDPIEQGVLIVDASGTIQAVEHRSQHDPASLEIYRGVLVPGFINTQEALLHPEWTRPTSSDRPGHEYSLDRIGLVSYHQRRNG